MADLRLIMRDLPQDTPLRKLDLTKFCSDVMAGLLRPGTFCFQRGAFATAVITLMVC
jgi:hypothetical protein